MRRCTNRRTRQRGGPPRADRTTDPCPSVAAARRRLRMRRRASLLQTGRRLYRMDRQSTAPTAGGRSLTTSPVHLVSLAEEGHARDGRARSHQCRCRAPYDRSHIRGPPSHTGGYATSDGTPELGPGGRQRDKTDSAVRLRPVPTGIEVTATEDRSQHRNQAVAWRRLQTALATADRNSVAAKADGARSGQFGEARSWTWSGWRDQVTSSSGRTGSMRRALSDDLRNLIR